MKKKKIKLIKREKKTKCINFLSDMCRSDKLKSSCFGFLFFLFLFFKFSSFYGVHGTWSVEYYPVQCL